jgi:glycosyltransferase involved in cell wall biosynthesis
MKLSLVVPVYGSEKILEGAYREFTKSAKAITSDYEILFRVDASPDNSEELLKKITKEDKHVKIYSHKPNRGLGYTLKNLFKDAEGDYIIYLDADSYLSFDLEALPLLLKKAENKDVVIASRYLENPELPIHRWLASESYNLINRMLFGVSVRDVGSGFVVFRKKAIKSVNLVSDGFDIHIEIYSKLKRNKCSIEEIPVNYKHWEGGSFKIFKHGPKTLMNTFSLWAKMVKNK